MIPSIIVNDSALCASRSSLNPSIALRCTLCNVHHGLHGTEIHKTGCKPSLSSSTVCCKSSKVSDFVMSCFGKPILIAPPPLSHVRGHFAIFVTTHFNENSLFLQGFSSFYLCKHEILLFHDSSLIFKDFVPSSNNTKLETFYSFVDIILHQLNE